MLILLGILNLTGLMRRVMDWLAIRGYGLGAHAHVIFGRVMIHTHDARREFAVAQTNGRHSTGRPNGAGS